MKKLFASLLMILSSLVSAQELHTFSNGEVADAEKINENFQYVLENATGSGGCSAEQDGSSVVITCADGTSGVLASEGTVVVYDGGQIGAPEIVEYPSGDIVVVDADDVVLGKSYSSYIIYFDTPWPRVRVINNEEISLVQYGPSSTTYMYYLDDSCTEGPFGGGSSIFMLREKFYWKVPDVEPASILANSYRQSDITQSNLNEIEPECKQLEEVANNVIPLAEYEMPSRLVNAKYPVRLKQLP